MNRWVEAARPKTLVAAVAPVAVGTAAADEVVPWRAAAALVVALSIQVGVNYANDLFDAERGIDTEARVGPRRAVAAGIVAPAEMKRALALSIVVAAAAGIALAAATTWWLLLVGLAAFAALLAYSGGPRPYASAGLGEVFVFVFFGLVATGGSAFVHDERLTKVAVLAAIPVGLLATAILVANNLRDVDTDAAGGKRTLAVRLGAERTRGLYRALVLAPFAFVPVIAGVDGSAWPMLAMAAVVLALPLTGAIRGSGAALLPVLGATARLELVFGLLLAVGLWMS